MKGSEPLRQLKPIMLGTQLEGLDGQWIAVRVTDGKVMAAQSSPDALRLHLHERDITGVAMMRVPKKGEPELVGIG